MFIDIHVHTASNCYLPLAPGLEVVVSPEQLIEMFDTVGIDKGVMLPLLTPENGMLVQSNEEILAIADKYPDRLIPFCNIDPRLHENSADTDLSFVINYYKDRGCKGIGELTSNLYFDDPRVHNLFHHAEKCEMPVLFHVAAGEYDTYGLIDDFGLPRFEKSVQAFPGITWLCHSQPWWAFISGDVTEDEWSGYPEGPVVEGGRVVELMRKYPNVCGELSAYSGYNAVSRDPEFGYRFLNEFQDQLFFATDVWATGQRDNRLIWLADFLRDALVKGKIDQEVFDKIAHKNAERVLKL
jgi:predicted TIM-barrel fold metal-dependent hydrolase